MVALTDDLGTQSLTPEQWVTEGKAHGKVRDVSKGTQQLRSQFLDRFAEANGAPIEEVIASITTKSELYESAKNFITFCEIQGFKVGTRAQYRSMIPGFFEAVFPESYDRKVFETKVKTIKMQVTTSKASFDRDMLVRLLKMASPLDKALLYVQSYGFRIGEVVSRELSDIENKGAYGIVKLWSDQTKTREARQEYVSGECLRILREYRALLPETQQTSKWLFPGEKGHLHKGRASARMKKLFRAAGLKDTEREIYSSHGLRAFAEDTMRECGMSETHVKQITGHDTGTEESYKRWPAIEKAWVEKCLDKMTWLAPTEVVLTENPETKKELDRQRAKVDKLEGQVGELLGVLRKALPDTQPRQLMSQELLEILRAKEGLPGLTMEEAVRIVLAKERKQLPASIEPADDARSKVSN